MFTALFTAALALASVSAASLSTRATTCETRFAGILAAKAGDGLKSFVLSPRNQIAYVGDGQNPLIAEFQECTSLETAPHNASILTGQLYAPHYGKCFAVTKQSNAAPPYYTILETCSTAYAQRWRVFLDESGSPLYFTGVSNEQGTTKQGGCTQLGYKAATDGTPVITHTNQQITLECNATAPFYFSTYAA